MSPRRPPDATADLTRWSVKASVKDFNLSPSSSAVSASWRRAAVFRGCDLPSEVGAQHRRMLRCPRSRCHWARKSSPKRVLPRYRPAAGNNSKTTQKSPVNTALAQASSACPHWDLNLREPHLGPTRVRESCPHLAQAPPACRVQTAARLQRQGCGRRRHPIGAGAMGALAHD